VINIPHIKDGKGFILINKDEIKVALEFTGVP